MAWQILSSYSVQFCSSPGLYNAGLYTCPPMLSPKPRPLLVKIIWLILGSDLETCWHYAFVVQLRFDRSSHFTASICLCRYSVAAKLLEGLKIFQAKAADADVKEAKPEGMSGKQAKRQAKAAARQSIYVEGAEQIVRISMPSKGFLKAHYIEEFDALVSAC